MEFEKWGPTTYLFWAALMIVVWASDSFPVLMVCLGAFLVSLVWQLTQWLIIRRQRKAEQAV